MKDFLEQIQELIGEEVPIEELPNIIADLLRETAKTKIELNKKYIELEKQKTVIEAEAMKVAREEKNDFNRRAVYNEQIANKDEYWDILKEQAEVKVWLDMIKKLEEHLISMMGIGGLSSWMISTQYQQKLSERSQSQKE